MKNYPDLVVERHENVYVVRDDLFEYGSKCRFLDTYFAALTTPEVVYGSSPRWGFAQISIAYLAKKYDLKATLFVPWSKELSEYSKRAKTLGANVIQVPVGFTSVCEARAQDHAKKTGALVLPCGLDVPEALVGIERVAKRLTITPVEVYTVASSGVLTRGLQRAFPHALFFAIQVGRKLSQDDVGRATIIESGMPFAKQTKHLPPFPSVPEYDAKAWKFIPKDGDKVRLFWNVGA